MKKENTEQKKNELLLLFQDLKIIKNNLKRYWSKNFTIKSIFIIVISYIISSLYGFFTFDLIPDILPIIGYLDDSIIFVLTLIYVYNTEIKQISKEVVFKKFIIKTKLFFKLLKDLIFHNYKVSKQTKISFYILIIYMLLIRITFFPFLLQIIGVFLPIIGVIDYIIIILILIKFLNKDLIKYKIYIEKKKNRH